MKKILSLILSVCLLASLVCLPAMAEENPFAEPVELVWYAIGTGPSDGEMVMEAFNKLLKEKYNTTIKLNYTGWDDWENKYNLLLTSGEKIDLVYVNATLYNRYAPAGAFIDLTEMFPELMPQTYSFFNEDALKEISVDGKVYAVPLSVHGYIPYGVFYRKDLADKSEKLLLKEWLEHRHVHENYNAVTGEGCDSDNSDRFYHWGALLGVVAMAEKRLFPGLGQSL